MSFPQWDFKSEAKMKAQDKVNDVWKGSLEVYSCINRSGAYRSFSGGEGIVYLGYSFWFLRYWGFNSGPCVC
jgi:hypothetical protein